jgi:hypothetical protein
MADCPMLHVVRKCQLAEKKSTASGGEGREAR